MMKMTSDTKVFYFLVVNYSEAPDVSTFLLRTNCSQIGQKIGDENDIRWVQNILNID